MGRVGSLLRLSLASPPSCMDGGCGWAGSWELLGWRSPANGTRAAGVGHIKSRADCRDKTLGGGYLVEGFPDLRQFGIFQLCLTQLKATKNSQKTVGSRATRTCFPWSYGLKILTQHSQLLPSGPTSLAGKLPLGKGLSSPGTASQGRGGSPCPKGLKSHGCGLSQAHWIWDFRD